MAATEKQSRLLEIGLTIAAACITCYVTVITGQSELKTKVEAIQAHDVVQDSVIGSVQATVNLQATRQAVTDNNYEHILAELAEIKQRLKR